MISSVNSGYVQATISVHTRGSRMNVHLSVTMKLPLSKTDNSMREKDRLEHMYSKRNKKTWTSDLLFLHLQKRV